MNTSIIVFWLRTDGTSASADLTRDGLAAALKYVAVHRDQGMRHVTISCENANQVGKPGVDSVDAGKTPSGQDYEWSKAGRAGKTKRGSEMIPARDGRNL